MTFDKAVKTAAALSSFAEVVREIYKKDEIQEFLTELRKEKDKYEAAGFAISAPAEYKKSIARYKKYEAIAQALLTILELETV